MSLYEEQLEAKIKRQKSEITRLLKENAELKSARAEGQQEAWKLAKKIALAEIFGGYKVNELEEIFGSIHLDCIFDLTYTEATTKVAEWERKKEEICVGDVLLSKTIPTKCIVISFEKLENTACILWKDGSSGKRNINELKKDFKKIGHIDVASMLAQIGGEE